MTSARAGHTATLLRDGTVLIAGGGTIWPAATAGAEIYHPAGIKFTPQVQLVDKDTGSMTTLTVGDSFSFLVTGSPASSLLSVSYPGWPASLG